MSSPILVVDDEPSICWAFERLLREEGHDVLVASSAEDGLRLAAQQRPCLVLLDIRLPQEDGISALPKFLAATHDAPVVVMTAFGDLETAVAAVQRGASDYLTKPFHLDDALQVCKKALLKSDSSTSGFATIRKLPTVPDELVGRSPAIQLAFRQIALVAASDLSVLITGETGTGKELVAAAIHRHSHRSAAPYIPVAPVAMNPDLIESELFGHVKGAFTGASEDRQGLFEQAQGGTILLDEIGELPLSTQVKLLRVLEKGDYCRVGDTRPRSSNVRILAATNCDLRSLVQQGTFREDLYYRLNGLQIHLPPLRERREDLRTLCEYFLTRVGYPNPTAAVDEPLLETLGRRAWPGNVRELKNAIEHAAILARGRSLVMDDFPREAGASATVTDHTSTSSERLKHAVSGLLNELVMQPANEVPEGLQSRILSVIEPVMLEFVLKHANGNRIKAAELLGVHRGTLRDRLRHYGIERTVD